MDKSNLAIVVLLSLAWHECQKSCFFGNNCVLCAMCHDKHLVVSTSIPVFLEFFCITPIPQLYQECHSKHYIVKKGEHICKEKRFPNKICGDSPPFTHPNFFFKSPAVYGLA